MEVSPYKFNQPGGEAKPDYVHVAPCPDVYGGKFTDKMYPDADMGALYAQPIEEICQKQLAKGQGVAAFIAESLQSCGGQILPPAGYFRQSTMRYALPEAFALLTRFRWDLDAWAATIGHSRPKT